MDRGAKFLERLTVGMDLEGTPIPGQAIIEIAGHQRVLIENHYGICAYSNEKIVIKVWYGFVTVCGGNLEIVKMNRPQLVIRGEIESVSLQRREQR